MPLLTHWLLSDVVLILQECYFNIFFGKLILDESYRTSLMISQHWLNCWWSAWWQQAITWINVEPNIYYHIMSPGHNELMSVMWWKCSQGREKIVPHPDNPDNCTIMICTKLLWLFMCKSEHVMCLMVGYLMKLINNLSDSYLWWLIFLQWMLCAIHLLSLWLQHLTHCGLVTPYGVIDSIGFVNGFLSDVTKLWWKQFNLLFIKMIPWTDINVL